MKFSLLESIMTKIILWSIVHIQSKLPSSWLAMFYLSKRALYVNSGSGYMQFQPLPSRLALWDTIQVQRPPAVAVYTMLWNTILYQADMVVSYRSFVKVIHTAVQPCQCRARTYTRTP